MEVQITNARFNEGDETIQATFDGQEMSIPTDEGNRHYAELVEQGITPAAYVAPDPTWQEKRQANIAGGGYGAVTEQLEIIGEQGMTVFQDHIAAVKAAHPKP
tara:strand:- start:2583 stop:2891 length:309 start_codon:yes stop_codon:yes gene_type:complete